jgi:hypothetical protein
MKYAAVNKQRIFDQTTSGWVDVNIFFDFETKDELAEFLLAHQKARPIRYEEYSVTFEVYLDL